MKFGFEGVVASTTWDYVPNGYAGLDWPFYAALGKDYMASQFPVDDGYDHVLAGKVVGAILDRGDGHIDATVTTEGDRFSLKAGTFASAWDNGESVTFTALRGAHVQGTLTVVFNQAAQTIHFGHGFKHITGFQIVSSGGTDANAGDNGHGAGLAVDNLQIVFDSMAAHAAHADHATHVDHTAHADHVLEMLHGPAIAHTHDWMFA
jgi:hypothetical protein